MMPVDVGVAAATDPVATVLRHIVRAQDELASFWSNARGWAPDEAAMVFERCRLDRQTQLARCLRIWVDEGAPEESDGRLVLARANLGALVEGAMQLGLTVFHADYSRSERATRDAKGMITDAPDLMLNKLRIFFRDEFWLPEESANWDPWVLAAVLAAVLAEGLAEAPAALVAAVPRRAAAGAPRPMARCSYGHFPLSPCSAGAVQGQGFVPEQL